MEKIDDSKHQRRSSCQSSIQLKQSLVVLSCLQALRALWQVWESFDRRWPVSIHNIMNPIIYASCSLVISLMLISVSSTYSVYKVQQRSATIGWWTYYIITIFYIITNFIFLSLMYMNKRSFITGCFMDHDINFDGTIGAELSKLCSHFWQETVIWAALDIMVNIVINTMFIYVLYRCRVDQYFSIQFSRDQSTTFKPTHSTTTTLTDISNVDDFHVIDLNKE